jgi:7tm Odorant receptor
VHCVYKESPSNHQVITDLYLAKFIYQVKSNIYNFFFRLCTIWENCFSNVLFIQTFISCLVLCASAYELSKVRLLRLKFTLLETHRYVLCMSISILFQTNLIEDPENFVKFGLYAGIMVLEIFLPCYFGSRINEKTLLLRQKVFESQWLDASLEYKKLLVIFLERAKRPVKINIYGFFFLQLETFTSVSDLFRQF